jgi:hypothetical protein
MRITLSILLGLFLVAAPVGAIAAKPAPRAPVLHPVRGACHDGKRQKAAKKCLVKIAGSRLRQPPRLTPTPTITLTARQIRQNGHTTLCGALRQVAAAEVTGCGDPPSD